MRLLVIVRIKSGRESLDNQAETSPDSGRGMKIRVGS